MGRIVTLESIELHGESYRVIEDTGNGVPYSVLKLVRPNPFGSTFWQQVGKNYASRRNAERKLIRMLVLKHGEVVPLSAEELAEIPPTLRRGYDSFMRTRNPEVEHLEKIKDTIDEREGMLCL